MAREWWIVPAGGIAYTRADRPKGHRESYYTHVIEHSAYEALLKEARALVSAIDIYSENESYQNWDELLAVRESFRAFLAENKLDTTTKE